MTRSYQVKKSFRFSEREKNNKLKASNLKIMIINEEVHLVQM